MGATARGSLLPLGSVWWLGQPNVLDGALQALRSWLSHPGDNWVQEGQVQHWSVEVSKDKGSSSYAKCCWTLPRTGPGRVQEVGRGDMWLSGTMQGDTVSVFMDWRGQSAQMTASREGRRLWEGKGAQQSRRWKWEMAVLGGPWYGHTGELEALPLG